MTRLTNVTFWGAAGSLAPEVENFFPKDIVSFGAVIKRVFLILHRLSSITHSEWEACCKVKLDPEYPSIYTSFTRPDEADCGFIVVNDYRSREQFLRSYRLVSNYFAKDKFCAEPHLQLDLRYANRGLKYRYYKYCCAEHPDRPLLDSEFDRHITCTVFLTRVKPEETSLFDKVKRVFNHPDTFQVLDEPPPVVRTWRDCAEPNPEEVSDVD